MFMKQSITHFAIDTIIISRCMIIILVFECGLSISIIHPEIPSAAFALPLIKFLTSKNKRQEAGEFVL